MVARFSKMSSYSAICFNVSSWSFINASISKPISFCKRISRIAVVWRSVKRSSDAIFSDCADLKVILSVTPSVRHALASFTFLLPRRISIIRSMTSHALINPSCISFLSNSFFSNVWYFLVASSYWNFTWWRMIGTSPSVSGRPSATASIFTPNVSSNFVFLYSRLMRFCVSAPFRSSNTIRIPSLEDWFVISTISFVFLVSTRLYTSFKNFPMFAPIIVYGISVITMRSFPPLTCSTSTFPRILILPIPVE